MLIFKPIFNDI